MQRLTAGSSGPQHVEDLLPYHPGLRDQAWQRWRVKLLLVAFSGWRVERCVEDQKGEIGLDHFEGRKWLGLQRHLAPSAVSYLFLARAHQRLRGNKSGADRVPGAYRDLRRDPQLVA